MATENEYVDKIIDNQINKIQSAQNVYEKGKVSKVYDNIVEIIGLADAAFYEEVEIEDKAICYVLRLEANKVIAVILSAKKQIAIGDNVYETNRTLGGEFSNQSFGKVIDMFGYDKLTNSKFNDCKRIPVFIDTIPIMDRTPVKRPLETGIAGIDLIYPIGKGQRQLIIGNKKIGKTQIGLDTIVNQSGKNMICIYCAIGKTKKEVKEIYYELLKRNAMSYTIILSAFYDDKPSILALAPYFAVSIANLYMQNGFDTLVIMDDLKRNAEAYREICLSLGVNPGRDAYPADIFYFHSRLLENGCQYKNGGSITILPIIETKGDDITDYISTNIISITDGQIVLSTKNFNRGEKPAINYGLSVSRLGGNVQTKEMKELGTSIRKRLLSYLETREIYELANMDEISEELREKLFNGKKILDSLCQYKFSPLSYEEITQKLKENGVIDG